LKEDPNMTSEEIFTLGLEHLYGWFDKQENVEKAKELVLRASRLGCHCAMAECAYKGWGEEKDVDKAFKSYSELAKKSNTHAMHRLGCYWDFDAENVDPKEAVRWYRRAAKGGHISASYNLSVAYNFGLGVAKNPREAFKWCSRSANLGHRSGQHNLACAYERGRGIASPDEEKAVEWYLKAAKQGHPKSKYNLGICYLHGTGVMSDEEKGLEWLMEAAASGHVPAHYQIGQFYLNHRKGSEARKEAIKWLWWAQDKGCPNAAARLMSLPKKEVGAFFKEKQQAVRTALTRDFDDLFMLHPDILKSFANIYRNRGLIVRKETRRCSRRSGNSSRSSSSNSCGANGGH